MSTLPSPDRPNKILPVSDVKFQKGLNSDYLLFIGPAAGKTDDGKTQEAAIYYARIDFTDIGQKDPHKLLDAISKNMHPIESLEQRRLRAWDVNGNDHVLAVAYSFTDVNNKTTSKLMVLTSQDGEFAKCDEVDHSVSKINSIKVIVPNKDKDLAYVIYCLSTGMDASGH
jgi:hypothetical protein